MRRTFTSKNKRTWLKDVHESRSNRSIALGKEAMDLLVKEDLPVTLKTVSEKSKEIDHEGKGIHPNTIRGNEELYTYYQQHSKSYKQKANTRNGKPKKSAVSTIDYRRLSPTRDRERLYRRYSQLSKQELVDRLIQAEEYIAEQNKIWVAKAFETFQ